MDREDSYTDGGSRSAEAIPVSARQERYRATGLELKDGIRRPRRLNIPATLAGTLAAIGLLLLLSGLIAAALGAIGYQTGLSGNRDELSLGGLIGGLVALFIAFVIGGWVAARIARFRGGLHGLMTGVWMVILALILAGLGAWAGAEYNVFSHVGLPQWFSSDALTAGAIISGIVAVAAMLFGGWLGGRWGDGDRDGDLELVDTRRAVTTREGGLIGHAGDRS